MALHFELNTGDRIPALGLGTWQGATQEEQDRTVEVVKAAIEIGYRHIDAASLYGNQKQIGVALQDAFARGVVKREDLWVTSKLWCTEHGRVAEALKQTLRDLQLDYLDMYLMHYPVRMKSDVSMFDMKPENFEPLQLKQTWQDMEKLVETKKVRAIGVSNFSPKVIDELLSFAEIVPAVNQVECHPVFHQKKLHQYCGIKGIHLSGYSPLGHRKSTVLGNPIVNEVAEKLGKSPAQVALRWGLQSGHSVLPKSSNVNRLKENFDIFDWSIPQEDLDRFSQVEQVWHSPTSELLGSVCSCFQVRVVDGSFLLSDVTFKTLKELWDE